MTQNLKALRIIKKMILGHGSSKESLESRAGLTESERIDMPGPLKMIGYS